MDCEKSLTVAKWSADNHEQGDDAEASDSAYLPGSTCRFLSPGAHRHYAKSTAAVASCNGMSREYHESNHV